MIHLSEVESFVKHALKNKLQKDLRNLRILKEADAECCIYHHLRTFLMPDTRWHVFARKFSPKTGFYTDVVIFRYSKPRVAIEIKWRRKKISKKDRRSLASVRDNLGVKKTYFYCVTPDACLYEKMGKKDAEKYRMFECVVDLGHVSKQKIEEFERRRKEFRF